MPRKLTDLQKAKLQNKSVAEIKYPKSTVIRKLTAKQTKVKWPKPTVCEQHQMIDYKTLAFVAKEQMKVIKTMTKQIADMEEKFQVSQEGVTELTKVYSDRILECNNIIRDLHQRLSGRVN